MMDAMYHDYSIDDVMNIKDEDTGLDFSKIGQDDSLVISHPGVSPEPEKPKKRRKANVDQDKIVKAESKKDNGLEPYEEKYKETNAMLRGVIMQIDANMANIDEDIRTIRNSKTLKRKYDYLSMMQGTSSSMLNNKITAIREINNSITKAQDFEMKRAKDLHLNDQVDDDRAIQEMYKSFVTASVPNPYAQLGPSSYDMTVNNSNIIGTTAPNSTIDEEAAYHNYVQNMTPQQRMIALEGDPNIKQVVVWNKSTGAKSFEIMNMATGEILNNVDKHDIMFMEDTTIDERNMVARNVMLNETYPLVILGNSNIDEY